MSEQAILEVKGSRCQGSQPRANLQTVSIQEQPQLHTPSRMGEPALMVDVLLGDRGDMSPRSFENAPFLVDRRSRGSFERDRLPAVGLSERCNTTQPRLESHTRGDLPELPQQRSQQNHPLFLCRRSRALALLALRAMSDAAAEATQPRHGGQAWEEERANLNEQRTLLTRSARACAASNAEQQRRQAVTVMVLQVEASVREQAIDPGAS